MRTLFVGIMLLSLQPGVSLAQWNPDPSVGTPVCTDVWNQYLSGLPSQNMLWQRNERGNIICAWSNAHQRGPTITLISPSGQKLWDSTCTVSVDTLHGIGSVSITTDARGGVLADFRVGDSCFVQRIDSNGNRRWGGFGIVLAPPSYLSYSSPGPCIPDGSGGMFITYQCGTNQTSQIYVQHVDSAGGKQWGPTGSLAGSTGYNKTIEGVATDGRGGIILLWNTNRLSYYDLLIQRVDANGVCRWGSNGSSLCDFPRNRPFLNSKIIPDGTGGIFIVWQEDRDIADLPYRYAIFAQHIDSSGARLWGDSGILVSNKFRMQGEPRIISDFEGGAIVSWYSNDTGYFACQRISPQGNVRWTRNGNYVADFHVRGARGFNPHHELIADGAGGAILVYESYLWPDSVNIATDIYAQRVDSNGTRLWPLEGKPVCTADSFQRYPSAMSDGAGGAFVAWDDERNGSDNTDIYGTRIDGSGNSYPVELLSFTALLAGDRVALDWSTATERDNYGFEIERAAVVSYDASDGSAGGVAANAGPPGTTWHRIGFVAGHGNSAERQGYHYDDPLTPELECSAWILYRLRQIDNDGSATYSTIARVHPTRPEGYLLSEVFPNPCSTAATIRCTLPEASRVDLTMRDMLGRRVATAASAEYAQGSRSFSLDATSLPPGVYTVTFITLSKAGKVYQQTRRLSVMR